MNEFDKPTPKKRFSFEQAIEIAQSGSELLKDDYRTVLDGLESDLHKADIAPSSIDSTFEVDGANTIDFSAYPDEVRRYIEVYNGIDTLYFHTGSSAINPFTLSIDILIGTRTTSQKIYSIHKDTESPATVVLNDTPLEIDQESIHKLILAASLPSHTYQLLESHAIVNGFRSIDLSSPTTLSILSESLHRRAKQSVTRKTYALPATDTATDMFTLETIEEGDQRTMVFSGREYAKEGSPVDYLDYTITQEQMTLPGSFPLFLDPTVTSSYHMKDGEPPHEESPPDESILEFAVLRINALRQKALTSTRHSPL